MTKPEGHDCKNEMVPWRTCDKCRPLSVPPAEPSGGSALQAEVAKMVRAGSLSEEEGRRVCEIPPIDDMYRSMDWHERKET